MAREYTARARLNNGEKEKLQSLQRHWGAREGEAIRRAINEAEKHMVREVVLERLIGEGETIPDGPYKGHLRTTCGNNPFKCGCPKSKEEK